MKKDCKCTKQKADCSYERIKKYRVYPCIFYKSLDKWLKRMSLKGWHIVECGIVSFTFEKGKPEEKEYFTYAEIAQEGKYSILLRHPFLEKKYGVKKEHSRINANNKKAYLIVEIDPSKMDIGYRELVSDRNRIFTRHFLRNACILTICGLVLCILRFCF